MPTELQIYEALARGDLPSPYPLGGSWAIVMRISGTGCAFRARLNEFAWRDPALWLTPEMCQRWLGAPVVIEHPGSEVLQPGFFADRVLGAVAYTWTTDADLMCVTRTFNDRIASELINPDSAVSFDTSPGVLTAGTKIALSDGAVLLIEDPPELCDHLAFLVAPKGEPSGVWSKDDPENLGVPTKETVDA